MKNIRKRFLSGEFPESCVRCQTEIEAGLRARPDYESEIWKSHITRESAIRMTDPDGAIDIAANPVLYMDLRMGNLCNLACRTCNPLESSKWYHDHYQVWGPRLKGPNGHYTVTKEAHGYSLNGIQLNWGEQDSLPSVLTKALETVQTIHFSGGEPLLLKGHYKVLDRLIETGRAQDVTLEYITNGTVFPDRLLERWDTFRRVKLGISIDGIGSVNEYLRHPSQWRSIEENLLRVLDKNYVVWLASTISAYNILYLPELIRWRQSLSIPGPLLSDHPLHSPEFLSVQIFPAEIKERISKVLLDSLRNCDQNMQERKNLMDGYINFMYQKDLSHLFKKFLKYTRDLDQSRGGSCRQYLPELADLVGLE